MSNYTDFFPLATGGGGSGGGVSFVTSPNDLPLNFIGCPTIIYAEELWHSYSPSSASIRMSNNAYDPIIGTNVFANVYSGQATQSVSGTEYTLLNISSGSGYLCNVTTALGTIGNGGTLNQKIVIIVDGTTYTYDHNPGDNSSYDGYYNRLFWGFFASGSSGDYNHIGDTASTGILGIGGSPLMHSSLPPVYVQASTDSFQRVFSVPEFKLYNLPKLRFESSLVVKVTTSALYSTSGYQATGAATYYLDTNNL